MAAPFLRPALSGNTTTTVQPFPSSETVLYSSTDVRCSPVASVIVQGAAVRAVRAPTDLRRVKTEETQRWHHKSKKTRAFFTVYLGETVLYVPFSFIWWVPLYDPLKVLRT